MKPFFLVCFLSHALFVFSQKQESMYVMFYNAENFFDTIDDPTKNDDEYLPSSKLKWDAKKFQNKINRLSQVIDSVSPGEGIPDIIGLCEIENQFVLDQLIKKSRLNKKNYGAIATDGRDERSIDVGLLYNKDIFTLVDSTQINATDLSDDTYKTRNILHATLKHNSSKEVFHVFVNHWPSRRSGEEESEEKRIYAAQQLRNVITALLKKEPHAKLIIMGDFNDHPDNNSVYTTLKAREKTLTKDDLFNPFYAIDKQGEGTHYHNNEWRVLDQIIVSQGLVESKKGYTLDERKGFIFKKDFVLFKNKKSGEVKPNRTYGPGNNYYNGYSDHLAVYIRLSLKP